MERGPESSTIDKQVPDRVKEIVGKIVALQFEEINKSGRNDPLYNEEYFQRTFSGIDVNAIYSFLEREFGKKLTDSSEAELERFVDSFIRLLGTVSVQVLDGDYKESFKKQIQIITSAVRLLKPANGDRFALLESEYPLPFPEDFELSQDNSLAMMQQMYGLFSEFIANEEEGVKKLGELLSEWNRVENPSFNLLANVCSYWAKVLSRKHLHSPPWMLIKKYFPKRFVEGLSFEHSPVYGMRDTYVVNPENIAIAKETVGTEPLYERKQIDDWFEKNIYESDKTEGMASLYLQLFVAGNYHKDVLVRQTYLKLMAAHPIAIMQAIEESYDGVNKGDHFELLKKLYGEEKISQLFGDVDVMSATAINQTGDIMELGSQIVNLSEVAKGYVLKNIDLSDVEGVIDLFDIGREKLEQYSQKSKIRPMLIRKANERIKTLDGCKGSEHRRMGGKIWDFIKTAGKDATLKGDLIEYFHATHSKVNNNLLRKKLRTFVLELIEEDYASISIASLLFLFQKDKKYERALLQILQTDGDILEYFIKVAKESTHPFASAFSLAMLARLIYKNPAKNAEDIIRKMFVSEADYEDDEVLTRFYLLALSLENPERDFAHLARPFLRNMFVVSHDNMAIASISRRFDNDFVRKLTLTKFVKPTRRLLEEVNGVNLPEEFEAFDAIKDIQRKTSLPVLDQHESDLEGTNEAAFQLIANPNNSNVGSWRLSIRFRYVDDKGPVTEIINADFENCRLKNLNCSLPKKIHDFVEKIGIYLAHQFFVRQQPEKPVHDRDPEVIVQTTSVSQSKPKTDETKDPADTIKRRQGREMKPLQIDLRERDKKALVTPSMQIKAMLHESRALICDVADGKEVVDLSKIVIHRKIPGIKNSQFVFEQLSAVEIKKHIDNGTLLTAELYILNKTPFMKACGYHPSIKKDDNGNSLIWRLTRKMPSENAQMAHAFHNTSTLPSVSALREIETTLGILVNDTNVSLREAISVQNIVDCMPEDHPDAFEVRKLGLPSKLAKRMVKQPWQEKSWFSEWLEVQKKVIFEELNEVELSNLSEDEKDEEWGDRTAKLDSMDELARKANAETRITIDERNPDESYVNLPHGFVKTDTTFNQGQYIPLIEFVTKMRSK